jgi:hypothetical protein
VSSSERKETRKQESAEQKTEIRQQQQQQQQQQKTVNGKFELPTYLMSSRAHDACVEQQEGKFKSLSPTKSKQNKKKQELDSTTIQYACEREFREIALKNVR